MLRHCHLYVVLRNATDMTEILSKVALNTINQPKTNGIYHYVGPQNSADFHLQIKSQSTFGEC